MRIEWITKKTCLKPVFANSFSFSPSIFFWERREKGKRITSCRTFSDPIDFHLSDSILHVKITLNIDIKAKRLKLKLGLEKIMTSLESII